MNKVTFSATTICSATTIQDGFFVFDASTSSPGLVASCTSPTTPATEAPSSMVEASVESDNTCVSEARVSTEIAGEQSKRRPVGFDPNWPLEDSLWSSSLDSNHFVIQTRDGRNLFQAGLALLVGRPKCGKSTFLYSLIADLTIGESEFGGGRPGKIIIAANEDSRGAVKASVLGAGGNLSRVSFLGGVDECAGEAGINSGFLQVLEERIAAAPDCRLVVVDSLGGLAGKLGFSTSSQTKIRQLTDGLHALGAKYGVAILLVNHFRKDTGGKSLDEVMAGSAQLFASVRAMWVVGRHPKYPDMRCVSFFEGNIRNACKGIVFRQVEVDRDTVVGYASENNLCLEEILDHKEPFYTIELVDERPVSPELLVKRPKVKKLNLGQALQRAIQLRNAKSTPENASVNSREETEVPPETVVPAPVDSYVMKPKTRNTTAKKLALDFSNWLVEHLATNSEILANDAERESALRGLKPGNYRKARKLAEAQGVRSRSRKVDGVKASYLYLDKVPQAAQPTSPSVAIETDISKLLLAFSVQ